MWSNSSMAILFHEFYLFVSELTKVFKSLPLRVLPPDVGTEMLFVFITFHEFFHWTLPWLCSPIITDPMGVRILCPSALPFPRVHTGTQLDLQRRVNIREKMAYEVQLQLQVLASCEYFTLPAVLQRKWYPLLRKWARSSYCVGRSP